MSANQNSDMDIDFSKLLELAQSNPSAFEDHRNRLVEDLINSAPRDKRHRLRCLQWKVDQVRLRAKTPMAACINIYSMMWDSLVGNHGLLECMSSGCMPASHGAAAKVLQFPSLSNSLK